jgi:hypothetical protein
VVGGGRDSCSLIDGDECELIMRDLDEVGEDFVLEPLLEALMGEDDGVI